MGSNHAHLQLLFNVNINGFHRQIGNSQHSAAQGLQAECTAPLLHDVRASAFDGNNDARRLPSPGMSPQA